MKCQYCSQQTVLKKMSVRWNPPIYECENDECIEYKRRYK